MPQPLRLSHRVTTTLLLAFVVCVLALATLVVSPRLSVWDQLPSVDSIKLSLGVQPQSAWQQFYVAPDGNDTNPGTLRHPFANLERARQAVRALPNPWAGDVIVWLRGGTYPLSSAVVFDQGDSGQNGHRVYYQSYGYPSSAAESVAFSGGERLTGWSDTNGDGIYETRAPAWDFRQLYVNGRRAIRARAPNVGPTYSEASYFKVAAWDPPGFELTNPANRRVGLASADIPTALLQLPAPSLNRVELVLQTKWDQARYRIGAFERSESITYAVPMEPERSLYGWGSPKINGQWYHFENALALLDQPGEWFLDTSVTPRKLYYKPLPDENMEAAVVIAPRLETLMKLEGTLDDPLRNVTFRGLTFEHTGWTAPSREGYVGGQAAFQTPERGPAPPAAIHLQATENVVLERAVVRHVGGSGIALHSGTRSTVIRGNHVSDISASGISVDWMLQAQPADRRVISTNDVIENNYVSQVGRDYYGGVGVFAGYTDGLKIEHNELADTPYTGISLGWGWSPNQSAIRNNKIRYNKIYKAMGLMEDGAGIYILSNQSPSGRLEDGLEIAENYIDDIQRVAPKSSGPVAGIYLDEGTSWATVRDNVLVNVATRIFLHETGQGNSFANADGSDNRLGEVASATVATQAGPGLEASYQDVRNERASPPISIERGAALRGADEASVSLPANLIRNGSFEVDEDANGYPDHWSEYLKTSNRREVQLARSGSASLKAVGPVEVYAEQVVELRPNTTYTLTGYVRTEKVQGRGVWFRFAELEPETVVHNELLGEAVSGDSDWRKLSATFTTTPEFRSGRLDVFLELASGTAWIDDLSLCEGTSDACAVSAARSSDIGAGELN